MSIDVLREGFRVLVGRKAEKVSIPSVWPRFGRNAHSSVLKS